MKCCPRQQSARSNGALVRCFGRNRCEDGCLALLLSTVLAVLCFPVLFFQLGSAALARRLMRGKRGDCCLQLFSCSCGQCWWHGVDDVITDDGGGPTDRRGFEASLRHQCVSSAAGGDEAAYERTKVRFVCLSDTHMRHTSIQVPPGDVLVHTGDFTNHGTLQQTLDFVEWFASQPHKIKICVPGNHDMIMDSQYWRDFWSDWTSGRQNTGAGSRDSTNGPATVLPEGSHAEAMKAFRRHGIHVLIDSALYLEISPIGRGIELVADDKKSSRGIVLTVFGSPWVTRYASWQTAFNKLDSEMKEHWEGIVQAHQGKLSKFGRRAKVPEHIDLLLTHMPPKGIGDMETTGAKHGCPHLLEAIKQIAPAVHVFGHVHSDAGMHLLDCNGENRTHCVNAASVCDYYWTGARKPVTFDLCPRLQKCAAKIIGSTDVDVCPSSIKSSSSLSKKDL